MVRDFWFLGGFGAFGGHGFLPPERDQIPFHVHLSPKIRFLNPGFQSGQLRFHQNLQQ